VAALAAVRDVLPRARQRRGVAPDQAFLAGLLHDSARSSWSPASSRWAPPRCRSAEPIWRRMVEDLHIEFGMVVVARWQLPEPISEVVTSHHTPHSCNRVYRRCPAGRGGRPDHHDPRRQLARRLAALTEVAGSSTTSGSGSAR